MALLADQPTLIDLGRLQEGGSLVIGRVGDIVIDEPYVSRSHCRLTRKDGEILIDDLDSLNGTYIDGKRIQGPTHLRSGSGLTIGLMRCIRLGDRLEYAQAGRVTLEARLLRKDIGPRFSQRIRALTRWKALEFLPLLHDVDLSIPPNQLVAIVGGSGAGKSTLMKALTGFQPATSGRVLLNGVDFYEHLPRLRPAIGYVPQDDIVHEQLTVWQVLWYASLLRLPPDTDDAERRRRVTEVIGELRLDHRIDARVQTLSGGERKRVSVGVEMINRPAILFLDEPTSGLDPGFEREFVESLRSLASNGRIVVMVTHSPQATIECDLVLFLAKGGYLVYEGTPKSALAHFGVESIAEAYSIVQGNPKAWGNKRPLAAASQSFEQGVEQVASSLGAPLKRPAAHWQYAALLRRNWTLAINNPLTFLVQAVFLPCAIGWTLGKNFGFDGLSNPFQAAKGTALLFFTLIFVTLIGVFSASKEIVKEWPIVRRERTINLRLGPYLLAKLTLLLGTSGLQCLLLLLYLSAFVPLPNGVSFGAFWLTLMLCSSAGVVLGLIASALARDVDQAPLWAIGLMIPNLLLCGLVAGLPSSPLVPTWWGLAGLGNLLGQNDKLFASEYVQPEIIMQLTNSNFAIPVEACWAHLVALMVLLFTILYCSCLLRELKQE